MCKWFFNKFIVKVREQVVADLGLTMPVRSYEEHLDDFLTMVLRMAGTFLAGVLLTMSISCWLGNGGVPRLLLRPLEFAHVANRIWFTEWNYLCSSPTEARLCEAYEWKLAAITFVGLISWIVRNSITVCRTPPPSPNFK